MSDKLDIYAIESALEAATHSTAKASEPTVAVIWDHDWIANVVTEEIAHVFCHAPQWIHQLIAEVKAKDKRIAELKSVISDMLTVMENDIGPDGVPYAVFQETVRRARECLK